MTRKASFSIFVFAAVFAIVANAAAPNGYYSAAEGKTGQSLLQALNEIAGPHTTISYDGLWSVYETSDITEDGKGLWDMYSTKVWRIGQEKCGNYTYVGDCVNREHSFPKSWFSKASPMVSDAFHIYPTDGKVNGQRSNFPYGECASGTTVSSHNGIDALGKLGNCTFSGYSGKVFEPDDMYKGDFARTYFYMAAAYYGKIGGWSSDMLSGNSYPAYKNWAINLLLKWHRQDAVSKKETNRNDAVYAKQKNRNPFIDHPELVEYIWGNKVGSPWYPGGDVEPIITSPANGSFISMGYASVSTPKSVRIAVKGVNVKNALTASVSNSNFTVSPATLSAESVNNGTTITVTFSSETAATYSTTLTLAGGTLRNTVSMEATAVNGLVAETPTAVTDGSFVARWINISGNDAKYDLYVERDGTILNGYPVTVDAKDEFRRIDGLEAETTYTYYIVQGSQISNRVSVTTAAAIPMIQLLFDGDLSITAIAGIPSEAVELIFETENITTDITLTVRSPFQVSTDKNNWATSLILSTEEDRFYLRLNAANAGNYSTDIKMQAESYIYDDVEFEGSAIDRPAAFIEDFETENVKDNYTNGDYAGNAALWHCDNAGVYNADKDIAINGERSARFGKNETSSLTMKEDKPLGLGSISFKTKRWSSDADATIEAEYSTDGGTTWKSAGTAKVTDNVTTHNFNANVTGNVRIRLRQVSGGRLFVDDIALTDYSAGVSATTEDYHTWDAYALNGELVIENNTESRTFNVYAIDGTEYLSSTIGAVTVRKSLPKGIYIVVADDFARKVLVK